MKRVTSWILKNPTRIALLLGLILGAVHASLLGGMLLRRSHIRDLRFQVDSLEANLTELRQIEDATLAALQQELEATQARAAELEASFPEIGQPMVLFEPAFEKARQRGVRLQRVERIAEELEDTEVGKLHFVTYAVEGEADLQSCLALMGDLEALGLQTLQVDRARMEASGLICSFDVVAAGLDLAATP